MKVKEIGRIHKIFLVSKIPTTKFFVSDRFSSIMSKGLEILV